MGGSNEYYNQSFVGFRYKDDTGYVGKLVVVSDPYVTDNNRNSRRLVSCVCDCGKPRSIILSSVLSGRTKTCGNSTCKGKINWKLNYTGYKQPNGNLTILSDPDYLSESHTRYVECKCSCGSIELKTLRDILYNRVICCYPCYMYNKEGAVRKGFRYPDSHLLVTGDRYVLGKHNKLEIECTCDCGEVKLMSISQVSKGAITCGRSCKLFVDRVSIKLPATQKSNGWLTAVSRNEDSSLNCVCRCGAKLSSVEKDSFTSLRITSCGCKPNRYTFKHRLFNDIKLISFLGKDVNRVSMFRGVCTKCNIHGIWTPDMTSRHICGQPDLFDNEVELTDAVKMRPRK